MRASSKRTAISKTLRFEIFKRDKFTCQYCGSHAPDVILEVDHIIPVSKGGTNELLNLVTSCRDCNRGKTNRQLSDNSAVKIQKQQLDAQQERREQLEMMLQWRNELDKEIEIEIDAIHSLFKRETKWGLNDFGRKDIRKLIMRFGFMEVYDATEISLLKYYKGTESTWNYAFDKIGGICYNRKKAKENAQQDH